MFDDSKFLKKYIIFDVCCTSILAVVTILVLFSKYPSRAYLSMALTLVGIIRISYYLWKYKRQIQTQNN
jgi:hypothetical protein